MGWDGKEQKTPECIPIGKTKYCALNILFPQLFKHVYCPVMEIVFLILSHVQKSLKTRVYIIWDPAWNCRTEQGH